MKKLTRRLILLVPAQVLVQEQTPTARLIRVREYLVDEMKRREIPGMAAAVTDGREVVWDDAWGWADREKRLVAKPKSLFRLASLSKPITAVAVMQLAEQGRLNLDRDIRHYVPAFRADRYVTTARQLLWHQGGIRHYEGGERVNKRHYTDVISPLEIFAQCPWEGEPGTRYHYSTYGYNLLGAAVQGASGQSYVEYVQEHILRPAGMTSVMADDRTRFLAERVSGYQKKANGTVGAADADDDTSNKVPGGGWLGTAGDMGRFVLAFRQCKLTTKETVARMLRAQRVPIQGREGETSAVGFGMGWELLWRKERPFSPRLVLHRGGQNGCSTFMGMTMDAAWGVVVLTNMEERDTAAKMGIEAIEILRR